MQALFSFFLQIFSLGTSVIFLMLLRPAAGYAIFKIQRGKPQAATPVIMLSYCTIAVTIRGSGGYFRLPLKISLFPFWPFFCTSLDFSELPCYTITRCKTRKTKVVQGFPPIPGVGHISTYMPPRHSSDVHASMPT